MELVCIFYIYQAYVEQIFPFMFVFEKAGIVISEKKVYYMAHHLLVLAVGAQ